MTSDRAEGHAPQHHLHHVRRPCGAGDLGIWGGLNHTPNLDRLAKEGMRHDAVYVTNSICTPSRAAILCGTHNHVNCVTTLDTHIDNRLPNVAKHLQRGGYRTAIFGKWHLGEGKAHEPTGFDEWAVVPGQGDYWDPAFIGPEGRRRIPGYATDIITDMSVEFIERHGRPAVLPDVPPQGAAPELAVSSALPDIYSSPAPFPCPRPSTMITATAPRRRRPRRCGSAPTCSTRISALSSRKAAPRPGGQDDGRQTGRCRKIPELEPGETITVICAETGQNFTFDDPRTFAEFKYQRYMSRYLRTVQAIDDGVGRMLDKLDELGLTDNTLVIYTSDQGFFLGEHGWFDKRFMYEESLQMPFLVRYPAAIKPGSTSSDIACNVDFAPTFLDYAGVSVPSYMQGRSMRPVLEGRTPSDWDQLAYHRYWMHNDIIHEAWAHYGVRDRRYKLIYWYNEDLGQPGARAEWRAPEWELFDCDEDPFELMNLAGDPPTRESSRTMLCQTRRQDGRNRRHTPSRQRCGAGGSVSTRRRDGAAPDAWLVATRQDCRALPSGAEGGGMGCCARRPDGAVPGDDPAAARRGAGIADRRRRPASPLRRRPSHVGTRRPAIAQDGEGLFRDRAAAPFAADSCLVTNARFAAFVADTGYVTEAERLAGAWSSAGCCRTPRRCRPRDRRRRGGCCATVPLVRARRPGQPGRRPREPPGGPCLLGRRAGLRRLGRRAAAERGGMGACGPRRPAGRPALSLGRSKSRTIAASSRQYLAGPISRPQHRRGRLAAAPRPCRPSPPTARGLHDMAGNVWEWTADPFLIRSASRWPGGATSRPGRRI